MSTPIGSIPVTWVYYGVTITDGTGTRWWACAYPVGAMGHLVGVSATFPVAGPCPWEVILGACAEARRNYRAGPTTAASIVVSPP